MLNSARKRRTKSWKERVSGGLSSAERESACPWLPTRIPVLRCALCTNAYMAEMARRHNDANVLALGGRVLAVPYALTLVDIFMKESFDGGRHQIRIDQITEHERSIFRD